MTTSRPPVITPPRVSRRSLAAVFTSAIRRHLDDEHYRHLQIALMLQPEQGPVIAGSGGLRKIRWATPGSGKRGGLRAIYYWAPSDRVFYMV